jgi:hypothetical protein
MSMSLQGLIRRRFFLSTYEIVIGFDQSRWNWIREDRGSGSVSMYLLTFVAANYVREVSRSSNLALDVAFD